MAKTELLERSCFLLEARDLVGAEAVAHEFAAQHPETAEAELLTALVERRQTAPGEPWLEAFLGAWASVGKPSNFRFLRGASLAAALVAVLHGEDSPRGIIAALKAGWEASRRLDEEVENAIGAARTARSWSDRLWYLELLSHGRLSPETRRRADAARGRLMHELREDRPKDLVVALLDIFGTDRDRCLSKAQITALRESVNTCDEALTLGELYGVCCASRQAESAAARAACLEDAMVMMPPVVSEALLRLKQTMAERADAELLLLMHELGARFSSASTLIERIPAYLMLQAAAKSRGHPEAEAAATAEVTALRRIGDAEQRLSLDWPLRPLLKEAADAQAKDEIALLRRCLFPAS